MGNRWAHTVAAHSELIACLLGPDCNMLCSIIQMHANQRTLMLPQGLLPEVAAPPTAVVLHHPQLWYCTTHSCGTALA